MGGVTERRLAGWYSANRAVGSFVVTQFNWLSGYRIVAAATEDAIQIMVALHKVIAITTRDQVAIWIA